MTQPTVIFLALPRMREGVPPPKGYLRTLLFATSKRGRVIESMHGSLKAKIAFRHATVANKWLMLLKRQRVLTTRVKADNLLLSVGCTILARLASALCWLRPKVMGPPGTLRRFFLF